MKSLRFSQLSPTVTSKLLSGCYHCSMTNCGKLASQKLAREASGQTLQATALVHEAYIRLVAGDGCRSDAGPLFDNRRYFFAAAAEAMRRILIDRARDKHRLKRGGGEWRRVKLEQIDLAVNEPSDEVLAVSEALEKLAQEDPLCAELVKLRFYAGLTLEDAAHAPGNSPAQCRSVLGVRPFLALRSVGKG